MCLGKPGAGSLARLESALIFEQAFMAMPEFLTGTPFSEYQFEARVGYFAGLMRSQWRDRLGEAFGY